MIQESIISFIITAFGIAAVTTAALASKESTACKLIAKKNCAAAAAKLNSQEEVVLYDMRKWTIVFGVINIAVGLLWFSSSVFSSVATAVPDAVVILSMVVLACTNAVWAVYILSFYRIMPDTRECAKESPGFYWIGILTIPVFFFIVLKYWFIKAKHGTYLKS